MNPSRHSNLLPAPLVAAAGWLLPGAGYLIIGQRSRALTVGLTILALFVLGMLIGGLRVVDPPTLDGNILNMIMDKPWFLGQILAGPITIICAAIGQSASPPFLVSHARLNEIGTLYTAVAGMLNLLAIIDSSYRAAHGGHS